MSEIAPTSEQVRAWFLDPTPWANPDRAGVEFDRWLAEVERAAGEKAVDYYAAQVNAHIEMWGTAVDVEPWPENLYRREEQGDE